MAWTPGTDACVDGTLSGELYAAIEALPSPDGEDSDDYRRDMCAALGTAIATHANEVVSASRQTSYFGYDAVLGSAGAVRAVPAFGSVAPTAVTVTGALMYFMRPGRIVEIGFRCSVAMGSTVFRLYRNGAQIDTDTINFTASTLHVLALSGDYDAGDRFAISLDPTNDHSVVTVAVLMEFDP